MLTKEQQELKAMVDLAEENALHNAIHAGCNAAEIHLTCSYPDCRCKQTPTIVKAAIDSWLLRIKIDE